MASAEEYAQWIVEHADQKGTPAFDVVAKAYQEARRGGGEPATNAPLTPRENTKDEPSNLAFVGGNLSKGVAGLAGMPVDFATNVLNLGIAGAGYLKGQTVGGELPDTIKKPVGGSQWFEDLGRKAGIITPDAEPESGAGRYAASALQAVPSALLGRPTIQQLPRAVTTAITSGIGAQAGADIAPEGQEAAGAVLGSLLPAARGLAKVPSAGERAAAERRTEAFVKAKEMGIPIPPRLMKPDVQQQKVQNRVTTELKLPEGTALSPETLQNYRAAHYDQGWLPVINEPALGGQILSTPEFGAKIKAIANQEGRLRSEFPNSVKDVGLQKALTDYVQPSYTVDGVMAQIQRLREAATRNLSSASATDDTMRMGLVQRKVATALEDLVEQNLQRVNKPELLQQFRDSRKAMAQSHAVEGALDPVTGKVNPQKLAALQTEKGTLTGELKRVAEVTAAFPSEIKQPSQTSNFLVTQRMSPWALTHPPSVAAHLLSHMLDPLTTSRPYQAMLVDPRVKLTPAQERVVRLLVGINAQEQ